MSSEWRNGSTTAWRNTRSFVLSRDGWRCRVLDVIEGRHMPHLATLAHLLKRAPECSGGDRALLQAHHVMGRRVTGDDERFIITACRACNLGMGDPSAADPAPRPTTRW